MTIFSKIGEWIVDKFNLLLTQLPTSFQDLLSTERLIPLIILAVILLFATKVTKTLIKFALIILVGLLIFSILSTIL